MRFRTLCLFDTFFSSFFWAAMNCVDSSAGIRHRHHRLELRRGGADRDVCGNLQVIDVIVPVMTAQVVTRTPPEGSVNGADRSPRPCFLFEPLTMIVLVSMCRHYKLEAEIASMTWKISWNEMVVRDERRGGKLGSRVSIGRNSISVICIFISRCDSL